MGTWKKASTFSLKTATGVLQQHLYEHYADSWIEGCNKLCIPITTKNAQRAVLDFLCHNCQANTNMNNNDSSQIRHPFSHEAFVDVIEEFIMADEQACVLCP